MDHQKVVRAQVTTAVALPPDKVSALQQGIAGATGRQVRLETNVDPSIIGGAVTRIGSTVYDGSVTTQLHKLKERLAQAET
jgi:F-type H+-transporting ATPase subunit delta